MEEAKEMILDRMGITDMLRPHVNQESLRDHSAGPKMGGAGCSEGSQSTRRDEEGDEDDDH
jgi:hypothetical protein